MKHLLNNLSEEEKNSIREQHEGGMKLDTSRFRTLLEGKSGNVKPLVEQEDDYPKINLRKHFDKERELNPDLMGDDEWDEFNNDFEDEDIEIYDRKHFEDDLDEMVGVDYMSDELGESSSLSSNRGLEKLIEKHSLDQILALFDNDEDSIDELMSTFEPLGITSYDELVDYKGEDSEFEDEDDDLGFAQHDGDFGGDDSEFDEEELDLTEFDDLDEDETW